MTKSDKSEELAKAAEFLISALIIQIVDPDGREPRTLFQKRLKYVCGISINSISAITFLLIGGFIAYSIYYYFLGGDGFHYPTFVALLYWFLNGRGAWVSSVAILNEVPDF